MPYADSIIDPTLPEELGDVLQVGCDVFEVGRAAGDAVPVRAGVARPQDEVCRGLSVKFNGFGFGFGFGSL